MAAQGFNNLYTLEKGIQNYMKEKGDDLWNGSLFVFDARMAVGPGDLLAGDSTPLCCQDEVHVIGDVELLLTASVTSTFIVHLLNAQVFTCNIHTGSSGSFYW